MPERYFTPDINSLLDLCRQFRLAPLVMQQGHQVLQGIVEGFLVKAAVAFLHAAADAI